MITLNVDELSPANKKIFEFCINEAKSVDGLNDDEIQMYTSALFEAAMWGRKIDEQNKKIKRSGVL